jgi:hypothetical protein
MDRSVSTAACPAAGGHRQQPGQNGLQFESRSVIFWGITTFIKNNFTER